MRKLLPFAALAAIAIGSSGCYVYGRSAYTPGYYGSQTATVYSTSPTVVYRTQPAYYYTRPVVYTAAPSRYYYYPTGVYTRPAVYGGVRVFVSP